MKKSIFTLAAFVALFALASCNKSEVGSVIPEEGYRYEFIINGEVSNSDDMTKATLDNEGVAWEASDRVGMFLEGYTGYANINMDNEPRTVILYSPSVIPANSYAYAYYPYADNTDKTAVNITLSNIQQGGASAAMPMAGVPFQILEEAEAKSEPDGQINFKNLGSIISFKVYSSNADYTSETIQYISLETTDGSSIAGTASVDLTAVDVSDESTLAFTISEGASTSVKVNQEVSVADSKANATPVYMVLAPGTIEGTITIGTDAATYTWVLKELTFKRNGIKTFNMDLNNAERSGVVEVVKTIPYEEPFTTNQGDFSINNVTLPEGQSSIWSFDASYGAKVSAYINNTAYASESWLVSPWIDLTEVSSAAVSFDHVHRYAGTASEELTFWAKSDDENAEWSQITIPTYASGSSWDFVNSGDISLSDYIGKKVMVAFKYISSTEKAATWEIKNFSAYILKADSGISYSETEFEAEVNGDFDIPKLNNPNDLTVTFSSSNTDIATVDESTGAVTIGSKTGSVTITATFAGDDTYKEGSASYVIIVSDPSVTVNDFTWNLSIASYDSASADAVVWSNDNVTMQNAKGTSSTAPNNYIPATRSSTRFYTGNALTITPAGGCSITKIEFTATSDGYATALTNSTWVNASATSSETTVTIVPADGSKAISATIGGTCGFTAVKVYYTGGSAVVDTEYTITISEVTNGTVTASAEKAVKGTEITLTVTPADNYELESLTVVDASGTAVSVSNNKFTMPESDVTVSATFKVKGENEATTYILTPVKSTSNTAYANNFDVTIDDVIWNAPGNQNFDGYWRIGGKSLEDVNRIIYGKTALPKNVNSIVIATNGVSNSNLTVNSITVTAHSSASDAASGENAIATYSTSDDFSFTVNTKKDLTFVKSNNTDTAEKFYRIVFNVTNPNKSNYGLDLTGISFLYN